jgi:hypothetical protein
MVDASRRSNCVISPAEVARTRACATKNLTTSQIPGQAAKHEIPDLCIGEPGTEEDTNWLLVDSSSAPPPCSAAGNGNGCAMTISPLVNENRWISSFNHSLCFALKLVQKKPLGKHGSTCLKVNQTKNKNT